MAEHETEHFKVETEYTVKDHASGAAKGIEHAFHHAAHGVSHLAEKFNEFRREQRFVAAALLGINLGLGSWIEKAKEANSQFYQVRKGIAGVLTEFLDWPKTVSGVERYNRSLKLANETTLELEESAEKYAIPLQDVGAGYRQISAALAPLHLSQKQVVEITEQTAAAAKVAGMDMSQASELVGRAVMYHQVRPIGILGKELHNAFAAHGKLRSSMTGAQSLKLVQQALGHMQPVAEEMSKGIGDQIMRIQMQVEKLFRRVSGPVFAEISKTLGDWVKKITEFGEKGKSTADVWAGRLVDAFHTMKDISSALVEHWKAIAAIWATFKIGSMAGGLGKTLLGAGEAMGGGIGGMLGGAGGLLGTIGKVTPVLGGLAAAAGLAAVALHGVYEEWQGRKKKASELGGFFEEIGKVQSTSAYIQKHNAQLTPDEIARGEQYKLEHLALASKILEEKGLMEGGQVSLEKFNGIMDSMADDVKQAFAKKLGLAGMGDVSSGMLGAAAAEILAKNMPQAAKQAETATDAADKNRKFTGTQIGPFTGPITINQKFDDVDPDRVWVSIKHGLEGEAERRTGSVYSPAFAE